MSTDIEGSPAMGQRLGDVYAGVRAGHHWLVRAGLAAPGGEEAGPWGDRAFAVFASPGPHRPVVVAHGG